jgi:hypothetical protein
LGLVAVGAGEAEQVAGDTQPIGEPLEELQRGDLPLAVLYAADVRLGDADQDADVGLAGTSPLAEDPHHRAEVTVG